MSDDNNIFHLIEGKTPGTEEAPVEYDYIVLDVDGKEHFASGFLLFTSQHVAIMRETAKGALPVLVVPLSRVVAAELIEDDEEEFFN